MLMCVVVVGLLVVCLLLVLTFVCLSCVWLHVFYFILFYENTYLVLLFYFDIIYVCLVVF